MAVAPLGLASNLPPVSKVSPVARVVRRPKSAKDSGAPGTEDGDGDDSPIAVMRTPAETSSSATQEALTKLELGG